MSFNIFSAIFAIVGLALIVISVYKMNIAAFSWMETHINEKDLKDNLPSIRNQERIGWICFILGASLILLASTF